MPQVGTARPCIEGSDDRVEEWGVSAWVQLAVIVLLVGALHVPLGNYLARAYTAETDWRIEKVIYRVVGVDSTNEQRWTRYLGAILAAQRPGVVTTGTLRTRSPVFMGLVVGATLIVVGLEFFPALALGPLVEGLS